MHVDDLMSPNRRIFLNFIATYGRSLLSLALGLFSGRWVLMALGEVDYGLYGLVGGLSAFVIFFNTLLAGAISRYFAVAIGKSSATGDLEECNRWFSIALALHTIIPIALLIIGYPIGTWAIENVLTIPVDRVIACVWVWRFTCIACFVGMITVPFQAMYVAKQYIAELTLYTVGVTFLNFGFAYYMVSHLGDWLAPYSFWVCLMSIMPNIIICCRAIKIFPECRAKLNYFFDKERLKEIGNYVLFRVVGAGCSLLQGQGNSILVNKLLGPRYNATMSIGSTVASQTVTLSTAMSGAIGPAIYSAYGAGDKVRLDKLVKYASKVGTLLYLIFMLPVMLEADVLIKLWLKQPPPEVSAMCICILCAYMTERITDGEVNALYATGRISHFQIVLGICCLIGLCLCGLFLWFGLGILGVGISIVIFKSLIMLMRVVYAGIEAGVHMRQWLFKVFLPMIVLSIICLVVGYIPRLFMGASILRVIVTTAFVLCVLIPLSWVFVIEKHERIYITERITGVYKRLKGL